MPEHPGGMPSKMDTLIPPPPFGSNAVARDEKKLPVLRPNSPQNPILTPMTTRDVIALIFILLMLPQGISCLVLTAYILSGSFKSMAGKVIAKYLMHVGESPIYSAADKGTPSARNRYYRSELVGEFLQLFSINSFILLVYHYTLPKAWLQYLIVLAKSIIASRLVGSYTTGSTTYVSVVSPNSTTMTTTTTSGQNGTQKSDAKYSTSKFFNSLLGFVSVILINNLIKNWILPLNMAQLLGDIAKLYRDFGTNNEFSLENIFHALFATSPFLASYSYFSSKQGHFYFNNRKVSPKSNLLSKFIIHVSINYLNFSDESVQTISKILRETSVVVNYAYLVLCIHVISLTISPLLQRIFILKDYSKTLDHLSCLTPVVPYGGFKKSGLIPTDTASDSIVVINVEQPQLLRTTQKSRTGLYEVKVEPEVAKSLASSQVILSANLIPASNFEIFCLVPPTNKSAIFGSRTNQSRTIVDRKRSNSSATPSTTIMDKYFTISVQPIWSWLAAIKILNKNPKFFAGASTKTKNNGAKFVTPSTECKLQLATAFIDDSKIVLEVLDRKHFDKVFQNGLSVRVNDVDWLYASLLIGGQSEKGQEKVSICIYGLTPLFQYEIDFFEDDDLVGHFVVNTVSLSTSPKIPSVMNVSLEATPFSTLQSSLKSTISNLNDAKASFKKIKKEENKKVADLKKQIDNMKSKIDKYGSNQVSEGRASGKMKGLQHSVMQLENEIREIQENLTQLSKSSEVFQGDYRDEEENLNKEIAELESMIAANELSTSKLKNDIKAVQTDKNQTETKRKKLLNKMQSREDEISRLNANVRNMKKALISKFQKRQKKVQERFDTILPNVTHATDNVRAEFENCFHELAD